MSSFIDCDIVSRIPVLDTETGVTHMMTDEQIGNIEIDVSPAELEMIHLMLAREAGLPEPELYQDSLIGVSDSPDLEKQLDKIIAVQERMAKGQILINEANVKLDAVRAKLQATKHSRIPYTEFCALIKARSEWEQRISSLWTMWNTLKNSSQQMADESPALWVMYFNLVDEQLSTYFTTGIDEDAEEGVDNRILTTDEAYALAHVEEMASQNAVVAFTMPLSKSQLGWKEVGGCWTAPSVE